MIIGAGEMAEETLNYIRDEGCRDIVIVNRTESTAYELAAKFDGQVGSWDQLSEELIRADLVVGTTGAEQPVVTAAMFREIEKQRRKASLFVLDLAVPRDFDGQIADFENVYLYTLDDLQRECDRNRLGRESHFPKAQKIIEQETGLFFDDARRREGGRDDCSTEAASSRSQRDGIATAEKSIGWRLAGANGANRSRVPSIDQ